MSGIHEEVPEHRARAVLAVEELGRAITEASMALRAIPSDDRKTAILCARSLDSALVDLASLLVMVPTITGVSRPGEEMRERLDRSRAELSDSRADVASHRATLDELAETEALLTASSVEEQALRQRVVALQRAIRFAEEIPGLRRLIPKLEADAAAAGATDAADINARLAAAVEKVASLTEHQRAVLSDSAARMVGRAETAAAEVDVLRQRADTATADVARHESDAAQLKAEHDEALAVLVAWGKADLALAEGMSTAIPATGGSPLNILRDELGRTVQRLTELDIALRPLLEEHASAYEETRRIRSAG